MEKGPLMKTNDRDLYDDFQKSKQFNDKDVEMPVDHKLRKRSIRVIYLISLFGGIAYTITMPSLWPYMKKLDQFVKPWYLGMANGGYSLGQLIGLVVFSAFHQTHGARTPLFACFLLKFSGDCLHVFAAAFPGRNGVTMLIAARFVTGLSNGQVVVCRTVLAQSSTLKERKIIFASLFTIYALGYGLGPGLQAVLAFILKKEYRHSFIIIDAFNAPGWLGMVFQIISFSSVLILFKEYNLTSDNETKTDDLPKPDTFALILVAVCHFLIYLVFAAVETLTAPLMTDELAMTKRASVLNAGILLSSLGPIAIISLTFVKCSSKRVSERQVILVGCTIALVGFVIFLPWGNTYPTLQTAEFVKVGNLTQFRLKEGCPAKYQWCKNTPKIHLGQLIIAELMALIGYTLPYLVTNGLFSKVVGPRKQGFYIAALSANSCLSGITSPLLVAYIYEHLGPKYVFITIASILSLFILVFTYFYSRIVPFEEYIKKN
ncbi:major facilitator superfamily domain-containing protein 8-like [Rhopilema esculentum]|uniref:major facilitator superfamily domain-containing protein 8-like n=1 Tax=Rhopilema esculentum TaxID=499914 RepID=UPI0031D00100